MVHLTYKTQVLMKAEDREGVDAVPTGANALLAIEPSSAPTRTSNERRVAATTLTRERSTRGRQQHPVNFGLDLRGRGTKTKPELSLPLRASGHRELPVYSVTVDVTTGFAVGDVIQQGHIDSAGNHAVAVIVSVVSGTVLKVGLKSQKLFLTAGSVPDLQITNSPSGGSQTAQVSAAALVSTEFVYVPDSRRALYVPLASPIVFSTNLDSEGEGVASNANPPAWAGVVRRYDYTATPKALYLDVSFGQPANRNTFVTSGGTGTVSGTPTWVTGWVPSVTIYSNVDGYLKAALGARGQAVIRGAVGETGRVDFSFVGKFGTMGDSPFAGSATFASDAPPIRIMGTSFKVNGIQLPTGSIEFDLGAQVGMRPDAGDAVGDISAMIGERQPVIRIDPEWVPAAGLNLMSLWDLQTYVPIDMTFGSTSGNTVRIYARNCEITAIAPGDREGIATGELELRPRRVADGDDEYFLHFF